MTDTDSNYEECYIAFLDLMGMQQLVKDCETDKTRYEKVIDALQETSNTSTVEISHRNISTNETKNWKLQVQAFSDCVVLFIPTESQALSWIMTSIRRLHDKLIRLEIPVRGSITIGGMHWDETWGDTNKEVVMRTPVAFGPGLVDAYLLESGAAVYPRILISNKLFEHIRDTKLKPFPFASLPLKDFCRQDMDGLFHLDVLHENIMRKDVVEQVSEKNEQGQVIVKSVFDETTYEEWLNQVRSFIWEQLQHVMGEKIRSKYLWLARYHNATVLRSKKGERIPIFKDEVPEGFAAFEMPAEMEKQIRESN